MLLSVKLSWACRAPSLDVPAVAVARSRRVVVLPARTLVYVLLWLVLHRSLLYSSAVCAARCCTVLP